MRIVTIENFDKTTTDFVIIDNPDGSQTSMTKTYYDAQQATQAVPNA